jgi:hypothetical protein
MRYMKFQLGSRIFNEEDLDSSNMLTSQGFLILLILPINQKVVKEHSMTIQHLFAGLEIIQRAASDTLVGQVE